jgi:inorganic pyrophosphatase
MAELSSLSTFVDPGSIHVVVESPRGSTLKLKYDPVRGVMTLSRPLIAGLVYPYDWGFVPSTRGPDGDPLDAVILWDATSYPGVVFQCRPAGILRVEQSNSASGARERNDRVAVIPVKAPRHERVRSVFDLSERVRLELERFFVSAVAFEQKDLEILGWAGPDEALALVRETHDRYATHVSKFQSVLSRG